MLKGALDSRVPEENKKYKKYHMNCIQTWKLNLNSLYLIEVYRVELPPHSRMLLPLGEVAV